MTNFQQVPQSAGNQNHVLEYLARAIVLIQRKFSQILHLRLKNIKQKYANIGLTKRNAHFNSMFEKK